MIINMKKIQQALNETWLLTWHPTTLKTKHSTPLSSQTSSVTPSQKKNETANTNNGTSTSSVVPVSSTTQTQEAKLKEEKSPEGPIYQRSIQLWFERGNRIRKNDIVEPKWNIYIISCSCIVDNTNTRSQTQ